jgi:3-hydroxybutyrate dehydrogenase
MNQDNDVLQDKVALVTGAASGIGLAVAGRLAAAGAHVVINDIRAETGQAAAQRLEALFIQGDLRQRAECQALIQQTLARYETIHILVNNAGFQQVSPIESFPEDTWDEMLALMLTAPFLLSRYAWPKMKAQRWGRVINIASRLSVRGEAFKSGYTAAKHGLLGLTRTLALEGGAHGITSHAICPAYVRTPLMENQIADHARLHGLSTAEVVEKVMLKHYPIKRLIEPEEIAALVVFLCRPEASAMSGAPLMIDLGSTIA